MRFISLIAGMVLLTIVLLDAFQSIILPRRPVGRLRITRLFFLLTWQPWTAFARLLRPKVAREQFYSIYGPLSLLLLFVVWAFLLTWGFGLVFFGLRVPFHDPLVTHSGDWIRLRSCLYVSGTTLFTLGLGDVLPETHLARLFTVLEAGTGLGFVALVIGYVPVLYTAFSHREVLVALLDGRAGSPPAAAELLLRHNFDGGRRALSSLLEEWERWCAEILETHISYPLLCYYRSQHDNQSWLAALTAVLDLCALLIAMPDNGEARQAQLTFTMGRHALVDLVHVFHKEEQEKWLRESAPTRLGEEEFARLCEALGMMGLSPCADTPSRERLQALRKLYEPSACALADYLKLSLPVWVTPPRAAPRRDSWSLVAGLRSKAATTDTWNSYVSAQSGALHLERDKTERSTQTRT